MKKAFNDFLDAYFEERLLLYPMEATQIGDKRYNNLLPNDISEGFRSDSKHFILAINPNSPVINGTLFQPQEKVSYDIFKREMEVTLGALLLKITIYLFNNSGG